MRVAECWPDDSVSTHAHMDNVADLRSSKSQKATKDGRRSAINGTVYLSGTFTPYGKRGGTEFPDADRLQASTTHNLNLYSVP